MFKSWSHPLLRYDCYDCDMQAISLLKICETNGSKRNDPSKKMVEIKALESSEVLRHTACTWPAFGSFMVGCEAGSQAVVAVEHPVPAS